MISDTLKNASLYYSLHKNFQKGFDFIIDCLNNPKPVGRYEIEGEDVFALVQEYQTVAETEKKWESHEQYIDIQYVADGVEAMGWGSKKDFEPCCEYSAEKDIVFYQNREDSRVKVSAESFAIFYPDDIHRPGCNWNNAVQIKKILIKVKI